MDDLRATCKDCGKKEHKFRDGTEIDCRSWTNWICSECNNDIIRESDEYSHKSGRKDNSDTWVMRFEQGVEMQNMAYNDCE